MWLRRRNIVKEDSVVRGMAESCPPKANMIKNKEHLQQIKDFSGLKFGSISPTDIDGFLDFGNRLFIFVETKYAKSELRGGQKLALERLCDACQTQSRTSILIVTNHDSSGEIDIGETVVQQYRLRGVWYESTDITLREAIEMFYTNFGITKKEDKNG